MAFKKPTKAAPVAQSKNLPTKQASKSLVGLSDFDPGDRKPAGLENVTAKDLIIPRLTILQALSPQLKKKMPEYIEGAQPGQFCDTALGQVFDENIIIVPCFFARIYLQWGPRDSGRGLVKNYGTDDAILKECEPDDRGAMILSNGDYIAETATFFCLNMSAKRRASFIPLSSTGLGAARRWMMKITAEKLPRTDGSEFTPPIYYRSWIASITEMSKNNNDWFSWDFQPGDTIMEIDPTKKLLAECKEFYRQASAGLVRGDLSEIDEPEISTRGGKEAM